MQWSDAKEQGPLLGPERVGQCVSGAQTTRNRRGRKEERGVKGEEIKREKRVGAMGWRAQNWNHL